MRHLRYKLWGLMHNSRGSLITIIKRTFPLNSSTEVKSSRYDEGYEVMLKYGTHIKESPKKKQVIAISGWGEQDVRISVPFTRDTTRAACTHANTEIMRDCHVFGTLAKQAALPELWLSA